MSSPSRRSQPQGSLHIRSTNGWGILAPMAFAKQLFIFAAAFCMVPTKKVVVIRVQRASKIAGTKKLIEGHCRHLVLLLYERYRIDSEHMNPVRKKPSIINLEVAVVREIGKVYPLISQNFIPIKGS